MGPEIIRQEYCFTDELLSDKENESSMVICHYEKKWYKNVCMHHILNVAYRNRNLAVKILFINLMEVLCALACLAAQLKEIMLLLKF